MLIVLVGARGAGKTTLLNTLKDAGVTVLQPSTTRPPRFEGETEYHFLTNWSAAAHAWRIEVGEHSYGMRKTELQKARDKVCVTVFEPLNLEVFEGVRRQLAIETLTIGLATIADTVEQHRRVGDDPIRVMDEAALERVAKIVSECDVVLGGDADTVARAVQSMIDLVRGRAGVVTKEHLVPLMKAGALLDEADPASIRPASYDLRVGREILFQGKVIELTEAEPRFELPPYSYAIVSAMEHANLPPFLIGRFDLKVSFFFEGIILSNGPQIDPGYKGALFCMLYNGSGQAKLLSLGKQFATIDFTMTTGMTEGYRQKYQLKQRMGQFLTDSSVTGKRGGIVSLVEEKVAGVDGKVASLQRNFWTVASAFIALAILAPVLTVPIAWIELNNLHAEKLAIDDAQKRASELLEEARRERAETVRLLCQPSPRLRRAELCLQVGQRQ